jgi:hypothetical protein
MAGVLAVAERESARELVALAATGERGLTA